MNDVIKTETKRFQCRHIFTDGHRCGSICLRGEPFCYYHHTTRKLAPRKTFGSHASFDLPLPEDRSAIQASIGIILQRIASNDLDPKRAGLLLYGLQIASLNLPKQQQSDEKDTPEVVEEITTHPELGTLAPQTEIKEEKSFLTTLLEELRPKPAILPQIQAVAQPAEDVLEKPSLGEVADETVVGGEEVVAGERREGSPLNIIEDAVVQVAVELIDDEELQVDGASVAVFVADAGDAAADGCGDAELFIKLSRERLLGGLSGLDLAPGELPFEAHGLVGAALADQHLRLAVAG
jgi:hypothetical protein